MNSLRPDDDESRRLVLCLHLRLSPLLLLHFSFRSKSQSIRNLIHAVYSRRRTHSNATQPTCTPTQGRTHSQIKEKTEKSNNVDLIHVWFSHVSDGHRITVQASLVVEAQRLTTVSLVLLSRKRSLRYHAFSFSHHSSCCFSV